MYKPLVIVGVATYNRASVLPKALESVLWQTYPNWICVVSDDGSTDNTKEVMKEYLKKDQRFRFIDEGRSGYYTINRNRCFKLVKGDLVAFRDDDGIWEPNFLEEMIKPHSQEDVLITYCGRKFHIKIDLVNLDLKDLDKIPYDTKPLVQYTGDTAILNGNVDVGDMVVKQSAFDAVGGFRETKDKPGYCSDMALIDDIIAKFPQGRIVMIPQRLHHYFLEWGGKQMTIEKVDWWMKHKKPHPELEDTWKF